MLIIKNDGHIGVIYVRQKKWGGCHQFLLVYDASKLSTVYVVKSPVLGLQRAPENSVLVPSVLVLYVLTHISLQYNQCARPQKQEVLRKRK